MTFCSQQKSTIYFLASRLLFSVSEDAAAVICGERSLDAPIPGCVVKNESPGGACRPLEQRLHEGIHLFLDLEGSRAVFRALSKPLHSLQEGSAHPLVMHEQICLQQGSQQAIAAGRPTRGKPVLYPKSMGFAEG